MHVMYDNGRVEMRPAKYSSVSKLLVISSTRRDDIGEE